MTQHYHFYLFSHHHYHHHLTTTTTTTTSPPPHHLTTTPPPPYEKYEHKTFGLAVWFTLLLSIQPAPNVNHWWLLPKVHHHLQNIVTLGVDLVLHSRFKAFLYIWFRWSIIMTTYQIHPPHLAQMRNSCLQCYMYLLFELNVPVYGIC